MPRAEIRPTAGARLLVNPRPLIQAARRARRAYEEDLELDSNASAAEWHRRRELLWTAVDRYEAKLRKGGRKP
jgi:hypothetical protein